MRVCSTLSQRFCFDTTLSVSVLKTILTSTNLKLERSCRDYRLVNQLKMYFASSMRNLSDGSMLKSLLDRVKLIKKLLPKSGIFGANIGVGPKFKNADSVYTPKLLNPA